VATSALPLLSSAVPGAMPGNSERKQKGANVRSGEAAPRERGKSGRSSFKIPNEGVRGARPQRREEASGLQDRGACHATFRPESEGSASSRRGHIPVALLPKARLACGGQGPVVGERGGPGGPVEIEYGVRRWRRYEPPFFLGNPSYHGEMAALATISQGSLVTLRVRLVLGRLESQATLPSAVLVGPLWTAG